MPAAMKARKWLLLLTACAALWSLSLFLGAPPPPHGDGDPHAVSFASSPTAERGGDGSPRVPRSYTVKEKALPAQHKPENLDAVREQYAKLREEQVKRNAQRFELANLRWTSDFEQRDAAWATPREQTLREALERDGVGERLRAVECGNALCRIQVAAPQGPDVSALGRAEHFTREVGVQTATAITGEGADRLLTLFVARNGARLEGLSAPRAEELRAPNAARAREAAPAVPTPP
jgi:hypothetical protein